MRTERIVICVIYLLAAFNQVFGVPFSSLSTENPVPVGSRRISACINGTDKKLQIVQLIFKPQIVDHVTVTEGETLFVNYTLYLSQEEEANSPGGLANTSLSIRSSIPHKATVESTQLKVMMAEEVETCVVASYSPSTNMTEEKTVLRRLIGVEDSVLLRGLQLGITEAQFVYKKDNRSDEELLFSFIVGVAQSQGVLVIIFRVFITVFILALTFTMGAALDYKVIFNYCKRPLAPAIGFSCQYVVMPLISFMLTQVIPMDKIIGFGLLTIGCSPGGGSSNLWTVLFQGDLNLSMTMTFFSTLAAFGMMPLWMFLLGSFYLDSSIRIPYESIATNMLMVVLPALAGMVVKWRNEAIALKLSRATQPISLVFLVFIFTYGTFVNWHIYAVMLERPIVLLCGVLLPVIGFFFGGLFAFFAIGFAYEQVIAIALETGIQNIGIAIMVLLYSIPQPYGAIGAIVPVTVSVFTPLALSLLWCSVMSIRKFLIPKKGSEAEITSQDEKKENGLEVCKDVDYSLEMKEKADNGQFA